MGLVSTETRKLESTVDEKRVTSSVNMCVGTKNTEVLQMAKAMVYNPVNSHCKMTIEIILNGGS